MTAVKWIAPAIVGVGFLALLVATKLPSFALVSTGAALIVIGSAAVIVFMAIP